MTENNEFLYETHLHTSPVSKCARASVRETLEYYKSLGYTGVFITNHFLDGNVAADKALPYKDQLDFFFSDYEEGVRIGKEIGLDVFLGIECAYMGTDFLVYGLSKEWYYDHPEIMDMSKKEELTFMAEHGALVIHAHPFREAKYIECMRLYPRSVHGVEVYNANRTEFENKLALQYAENYELIHFAGSDNHTADKQKKLGGMKSSTRITSELDFVTGVKNGDITPFSKLVE